MYEAFYHEGFNPQVKKLTKRNNTLASRLERTIENLRTNPYHNTFNLIGPYLKGKRRAWVGRRHRIVFAICEECRENEWEEHNNCNACDEKKDETLVFFKFGPRDKVYNV